MEWLIPLGVFVVAALGFGSTQWVRIHSQARQVTIDGGRNDLYIAKGTAEATAEGFRIVVSNDSDRPIRELEFSAWKVGESGSLEHVGSFIAARTVGPHSRASGDPRFRREGSTYPTRDDLSLMATFVDANGRSWLIRDTSNARRLPRRKRAQWRATTSDKRIAAHVR